MAQSRVVETCQQRPAISTDISALRQSQNRRDLLDHQILDQTGQRCIGHGLRHGFIAREIAEISKRRMTAIEQTQLHGFIRQHVFHQLRPKGTPIGTALREVIFDDPLREGFGHDRPSIRDAQSLCDQITIGIGCGRDDAIHHGRGKSHILRHQGQQILAGQLGELGHHALQRMAIGGQIVTGHNRERRKPLPLAFGQSGQQEPDH